MPTYSYQCEACKHEFDAFQKITDEALKKCPHCNQDTLKRGVGGGSASFLFKGSGFYITDYKNSAAQEKPSSCCPCGKNPQSCNS